MKSIFTFTIAAMCITAATFAQSNPSTVTLNMFNVKNGGTLLDSWIYLDAQNNFRGTSFAPTGE
ncbi:MAG: hypothetical protein LBS43_07905, partial [Prevotellaceae bacterium]|nr:hypothetical protein [Prevotellaceae bacterium]